MDKSDIPQAFEGFFCVSFTVWQTHGGTAVETVGVIVPLPAARHEIIEKALAEMRSNNRASSRVVKILNPTVPKLERVRFENVPSRNIGDDIEFLTIMERREVVPQGCYNIDK